MKDKKKEMEQQWWAEVNGRGGAEPYYSTYGTY